VVDQLVDGVITVTESEIVAAMRLLFMRAKLVVEPSGAVGLAAALKDASGSRLSSFEEEGGDGGGGGGAGLLRGSVGIILCGGNVDLDEKGWFSMERWEPLA
jgi:serine racemase